jgi:hypothetical protein
MKPNESLASDDAGRFRTTHRSAILLSAQSQDPSSRTADAEFYRTYIAPKAVDREIHALCEILIASEGRLGP